MDEVPSDTPEFESTAATARDGEDGSDVLQLGPADAAGATPALADDTFAMHLGDAKPKPVDKPSKPVTAAANASLIAALMGQPIGKKVEPASKFDDAATDAFARYVDAGKPAVVPSAPTAKATPAAPPTSAAPAPVIILNEHDPLPEPTPPPAVPMSAVAAIANVAPSLPALVVATPAPAAKPVRVGATPASPASGEQAHRATRASPLPQTAVRPKTVPPTAPVSPPPRRAIPVVPVWPGTAPLASRPSAPKPVAKPQPAQPAPIPTTPPMPTGAWWTIPLTFVGIAITACAVIVPNADENRRDTYELARIERDVDYFQRQSAVNQDFIRRIGTDATLAERLALRQLHRTREGAKVVALGGLKPDRFGASPYAMTRLDPPADLPPYQPVPGKLGEWFLGDKRPQQMAGLGLCVAGAGVLLGGLRKRRRPASPLHE